MHDLKKLQTIYENNLFGSAQLNYYPNEGKHSFGKPIPMTSPGNQANISALGVPLEDEEATNRKITIAIKDKIQELIEQNNTNGTTSENNSLMELLQFIDKLQF